MRRVGRALLLAMLASSTVHAADDGALTSSRTDYTRPGARELPVRCKPGDFEFFAGRRMGDVFGDAWPAPPAATRVEPPRVVESAPPVWPRGLGQAHAVAIVAVLVGADGRAIDAKALCASTGAMSKPAVRAARRSTYAPARFDGVALPAVAIRPYVFQLGEEGRPGAGAGRR